MYVRTADSYVLLLSEVLDQYGPMATPATGQLLPGPSKFLDGRRR